MLDDRLQDRRGPAFTFRPEVVVAFLDRPAVVAALFDLVDHLPQVLTDFAAPAIARLAVEAEAPQLPQAVGVDFPMGALHVHERIVLRHAVVPPGAYATRLAFFRRIDVNPQ